MELQLGIKGTFSSIMAHMLRNEIKRYIFCFNYIYHADYMHVISIVLRVDYAYFCEIFS